MDHFTHVRSSSLLANEHIGDMNFSGMFVVLLMVILNFCFKHIHDEQKKKSNTLDKTQ